MKTRLALIALLLALPVACDNSSTSETSPGKPDSVAVPDKTQPTKGTQAPAEPLTFKDRVKLAQKLLAVKICDLLLALIDAHIGWTITPNFLARKPLSEEVIHALGVGAALGRFHDLADEPSERAGLSGCDFSLSRMVHSAQIFISLRRPAR